MRIRLVEVVIINDGNICEVPRRHCCIRTFIISSYISTATSANITITRTLTIISITTTFSIMIGIIITTTTTVTGGISTRFLSSNSSKCNKMIVITSVITTLNNA